MKRIFTNFLVGVIILTTILGASYSYRCVCDVMTQYAGTCINETFEGAEGEQIYYCCNWKWQYPNGEPYFGVKECWATISYINTTSDAGSIVADFWTTQQNYLPECEGHEGVPCDVYTGDGFDQDPSNEDRGVCDSDTQTCIKCEGPIEKYRWTGGSAIDSPGDGMCDSACGAHPKCNERERGWYNATDNGGCTDSCIYQNCGYYLWNYTSHSCYTSCISSDQCIPEAYCNSTFSTCRLKVNKISVKVNEVGGNITGVLEFRCVGDGHGCFNVKALDSGANDTLGDITISHAGEGMNLKLSFRLDNGSPIPNGMTLKINNANDPGTAIPISNDETFPAWCQNIAPGENCEVWVWADIEPYTFAGNYPGGIVIESYEV